jgi:hypothetical protein
LAWEAASTVTSGLEAVRSEGRFDHRSHVTSRMSSEIVKHAPEVRFSASLLAPIN